MTTFSGTGGTASYQTPDGTWHELGPVSEAMTAIANVVSGFEALGAATATVAGTIEWGSTSFYKRYMRRWGLRPQWHTRQSRPLRPRKHGGRLPSYRDVRQNWHAT